MVLLIGALLYRGHYRPSALTLRRVAMIVLASAAMGALTFGLTIVLQDYIDSGSTLLELVTVVAIIAAAAIAYLAIVLVTGGLDRRELAGFMRRRRRPAD